MPIMKVSKIGYGMGNKDFEVANCVRVMLGETEDKKDRIIELNFNVDDMTPEEIGFCLNRLMDNGARDAFVIPVTMKKTRPGHLFYVLCSPTDKEKIVETIFKYSTTIGIREKECLRNVLDREIATVNTEFGPVRKKISKGYGVVKEKYEYDDLANIAIDRGLSVNEVREIITKTKI